MYTYMYIYIFVHIYQAGFFISTHTHTHTHTHVYIYIKYICICVCMCKSYTYIYQGGIARWTQGAAPSFSTVSLSLLVKAVVTVVKAVVKHGGHKERHRHWDSFFNKNQFLSSYFFWIWISGWRKSLKNPQGWCCSIKPLA